ncbi:MAG: hypothetical protein ACRDOH_03460 [Streptosporangiaceae bacterium]
MSVMRRLGKAARPRSLVAKELSDIEHGRFERALSGMTAAAAVITTAEVYIEHYKASFGNKWMWSPIIVTPPLIIAGIAGMFSKRWAKTALPVTAGIYTLNGLAGEYFHARGVARKPGGWKLASYNVPMGPPIAAPGLMSIVGAMGLLAAVLRREKWGGRARRAGQVTRSRAADA